MHSPQTLLGTAAALAAVASAYIPDIHARQTPASAEGAPPTTSATGYGDSDSDYSSGEGALSDECQSAIAGLVPLYSELPTPPPALLTATEALPLDPCVTAPPFTGAELEQWESYTSAAVEWYSSNSGAIDDALASCADLQGYGEASIPMCTSTPTPTPTGAASPTSDGEGEQGGDDETATMTSDGADGPTCTADDDGESSSTATATEDPAESSSSATTPTSDAGSPTPVPGAAPREKGVIAAAVAIVAAGAWGFML